MKYCHGTSPRQTRRGSSEVEVFAKAVDEGKGLGPYHIEVTPADKPKPSLELANTIAAFLYAGKDVRGNLYSARVSRRLPTPPKRLSPLEARRGPGGKETFGRARGKVGRP